jgi:hypothetical protein
MVLSVVTPILLAGVASGGTSDVIVVNYQEPGQPSAKVETVTLPGDLKLVHSERSVGKCVDVSFHPPSVPTAWVVATADCVPSAKPEKGLIKHLIYRGTLIKNKKGEFEVRWKKPIERFEKKEER